MSPQVGTIDVQQNGDVMLVRLVGDHDLNTARDVAEALSAAIASASGGVMVDLSPTTYCDSSCLAALVEALAAAKDAERRFVVVLPADSQLQRVFQITRLSEALPVVATLEVALDRTRNP